VRGFAREFRAAWHDRRRRPEHLLPWAREDASAGRLLWDRCAPMAGITPGLS
jgi:dehydrogenase/reductase SDR family member 12